jgi:hypothetical protein
VLQLYFRMLQLNFRMLQLNFWVLQLYYCKQKLMIISRNLSCRYFHINNKGPDGGKNLH